MKLVCLLPHLKNKSIDVEGTAYPIDAEGNLFVANALHRAVLLENPAGFCLDPADPSLPPLVPLGADGAPEYLAMPPEPAQAPSPEAQRTAIEAGMLADESEAAAESPAAAESASKKAQAQAFSLGRPLENGQAGIDMRGNPVTEADLKSTADFIKQGSPTPGPVPAGAGNTPGVPQPDRVKRPYNKKAR